VHCDPPGTLAAFGLGLVHGAVGVLKQTLKLVGRSDGDPDADAKHHVLVRDLNRTRDGLHNRFGQVARALGVDDLQQSSARQANDEKPSLLVRVAGVVIFERIRVIENFCGLSETDAVFLQIGLGLFIIPLEIHLRPFFPLEAPFRAFAACAGRAPGLLGFGTGPGFVLRCRAAAIAFAVMKRSRPIFSDSISFLTTIWRTRAGVTPSSSAASFVV
jgi:hypothetical protein